MPFPVFSNFAVDVQYADSQLIAIFLLSFTTLLFAISQWMMHLHRNKAKLIVAFNFLHFLR